MNFDANDPELAFISDQVQLCMLPALKKDLDSVQLLPSHFETYHSLLQQELPKLYDLLQRNKDIISNDVPNHQLRAQLILLLCELIASPTIYSLIGEAALLLRNADEYLGNLLSICHNAEESHIFCYYEQKLHKDCWKRQLGAVHGFASYLQKRYANDVKMSTKMITFSVAVGLNVRECFQSEYKQLGARIFSHMLQNSHPADIQQLNIQGVIYDNVFRDAHSLHPVDTTFENWNCLCHCLDHFTELDGFMWNQCDEMLERLTLNVSLSSDVKMSICLLNFITNLGYYFTLNKEEIRLALSADFTQPNQITACLDVCSSLNVCTNYRWAKHILQMLQLESEKLLQNADSCAQLLVAMQRCFLVCILPIPLQVLHVHLPEFYAKFVAVLMECLVVHKKAHPILMLTQQFIQIFIYQLKDFTPGHQTTSDLEEYDTALKSLYDQIAK
ncbi:uncharacterized protein LOC6563944 [Drosophila grimshawi]|uniref:GH18104 n=1 Tax=Drosophila grimshawi TaxID=7222 RepID=B4JH02_DROGR|nr:uncharacterized protein LOC6563944 [Drosophila grimshawi]EDV93780.1 GH18104 [Drosophila grimshawi]